jgi:hypothetical protein
MHRMPDPHATTDRAAAFERRYADNSGVTVEWLREHGRVVGTCYCGEDDCPGFQSISRDLADSLATIGHTEIVLP